MQNKIARTVLLVCSDHRVRQPPPYYSHLVQASSGKTPYIIYLFKAATSTSIAATDF